MSTRDLQNDRIEDSQCCEKDKNQHPRVFSIFLYSFLFKFRCLLQFWDGQCMYITRCIRPQRPVTLWPPPQVAEVGLRKIHFTRLRDQEHI